MKRVRVTLLAGVLAVALSASPAMASNGTGGEFGYGFGSAMASLVYAPTKVVYAVLGSVFGGFAWAFSGGDKDVAKAVIYPAVLGDYVVTPSVLRGEDKLEFMGRQPGYAPPAASVAEGPSSDTYDQGTYSQSW